MSEKGPKSNGQLQQRDAEIYVGIGLFIFAVGVPVLIGTAFALERPHAAIVNAICGVVLTLIGLGSMAYGWLLLRRKKRAR